MGGHLFETFAVDRYGDLTILDFADGYASLGSKVPKIYEHVVANYNATFIGAWGCRCCVAVVSLLYRCCVACTLLRRRKKFEIGSALRVNGWSLLGSWPS